MLTQTNICLHFFYNASQVQRRTSTLTKHIKGFPIEKALQISFFKKKVVSFGKRGERSLLWLKRP